MSKAAKSRQKDKRKKEKKALKDTKRALYEKYRDQGRTKKSARFKKKQRKTLRVGHVLINCGNAGCSRCTPINFSPFVKNGLSKRMPQNMWLKWTKKS